MIVLDDILVTAIGVVVLEGAVQGIEWAINKYRLSKLKKECSEFLVDPEFTTDDDEMMTKINEMLKEEFPQGLEARFSGMDIVERQKLVKGIILELQKTLGFDLANVNFMFSQEIGYGVLGYYNECTKNISINIDGLASDNVEVLRLMINTLVHECRHAYQYKAITDSKNSFGSEMQRKLWALNFAKYIPPEVDFAMYCQQIVESDARQFAEKATAGI